MNIPEFLLNNNYLTSQKEKPFIFHKDSVCVMLVGEDEEGFNLINVFVGSVSKYRGRITSEEHLNLIIAGVRPVEELTTKDMNILTGNLENKNLYLSFVSQN